MVRRSPTQVLQIAGVVACCTSSLLPIVDGYWQSGKAELLVPRIVMIVLMAAAYWYNTRRIETARPRPRELALVVLQLVLAFTVNIELLFVVAAQLPLVAPGRRAVRILVVLMLLLAGLGVAAYWAHDFEVSDGLRHTPLSWSAPLTILMMLVWMSFAFAAGVLIVALERGRQEIAWSKAELEGSQELLGEAARLGERLRISRELHDTVGHHLASLAVNLEVASHRANAEAMPTVERARLVAKLLLTEVREVVSSMRRDQALDLRPALEKLIAMMGPTRICLQYELSDNALDPASGHALYRCAQEALTNTYCHAGADHLWLRLWEEGERVWVLARDDGRGQQQVVEGNGLRGMRERLEELGGGLTLESQPGQGFTLRGWVPRVAGRP